MYQKGICVTEEFLDELDHVNYLNYVRMLAEVAFTEYRLERGIDIAFLREQHGVALVLTELNVKYFQALKLGDIAIVKISDPVKAEKRLKFIALIMRSERQVAE